MALTLMPPLETFCLNRVATIIWNESYLWKIIEYKLKRGTSIYAEHDTFVEMLKFTNTVCQSLTLNDGLLRKLFLTFPHLYNELRLWIVQLNSIKSELMQLHTSKVSIRLIWTSLGTIDRKLSAASFVHNLQIDVYDRFRIAMFYCREDDIEKLWRQLTLPQKKNLTTEYYAAEDAPSIKQFWLEYFNSDRVLKTMNGKFKKNDAGFDAMGVNFKTRYLEGAKHMWPEPHTRDAIEFLFEECRHLQDCQIPEVVSQLLFLLSKKDLNKLLKSHPDKVLLSACHWPLVPFFAKIASLTVPQLNTKTYSVVLIDLLDEFLSSEALLKNSCCVEGCTVEIDNIKEFWKLSSHDQKKQFLRCLPRKIGTVEALFIRHSDLLCDFLRDSSLNQKKRIMLSREDRLLWQSLLTEENYKQLYEIILQCLHSKDLLKSIKEHTMKECWNVECVWALHKFSRDLDYLIEFNEEMLIAQITGKFPENMISSSSS